MKINLRKVQLVLGFYSLLAVFSAQAESLLIATPQQSVGIKVDLFDNPTAPTGTPSATSLIRYSAPGLYVPAIASFRGKIYLLWSNGSGSGQINYVTSEDGKTWSSSRAIPYTNASNEVSVTVVKEKLIVTFIDSQRRFNVTSSEDGNGWFRPVRVNTPHLSNRYKTAVYNGQVFAFYASEPPTNKVFYLTSNDGIRWSNEKTAIEEDAGQITTAQPVVYNGKLWVYYNVGDNGFARTYDRAGVWSGRLNTSGIGASQLIGFSSAAMLGNRLFISDHLQIFASVDGLNWSPYFSRNVPGTFTYPPAVGVSYAIGQSDLISNNPQLPSDIATGLSHTDYAIFAWRSFFALNNQAGLPLPASRGVGNANSSFADAGRVPHSPVPLLWQTFAHRTELFPASGHNAAGGSTRPFGSDPQYSYVEFPNGAPLASGASFDYYNNLDEATQIGQNAIFFPVNPPNAAMRGADYAPSQDSQILFEAKANPVVYEYAKSLTRFPDHVILPDGAVEVKAAWRKLADIPAAQRSRYHTSTVIIYQGNDASPVAYNEEYALVALHIIHKTPNYPTFIFATFEHQDSLTLPDSSPTGLYYVANYNNIDYTQPGYINDAPLARFSDGQNIHELRLPKGAVADPAHNPPIYSDSHGIPRGQAGPIRVEQPQTVNDQVTAVNNQIRQLMNSLDAFNDSVWKYYKLKGVQAIPSSQQTDPDYYLANIMVESSRPGIQLFRGTNIFPVPADNTLTNMRAVNNIRAPNYDDVAQQLIMGGCMGCHGVAQTSLKQGFSFLFDAINPMTLGGHGTGFSNPETIGLPDVRTMQQRALKYAFRLQYMIANDKKDKTQSEKDSDVDK